MFLTATIRDDNGQSVGVIVLGEKVFKSGKTGYHGQGKVSINGRRHQCQCQLVQIASKSKAEVEGEQ